MTVRGAMERYLVPEGATVKLDEIDQNEKKLFEEGGKKEHQPYLEELCEELAELQRLLYAQGRHRVLVVIQAMDTGGKDGCVKDVFSRVDPQGIHVRSFKRPSEDELSHDFLWRVHRQVPRDGEIVVFNRSHYEDIVAVRVKEIFGPEVWKPRFRHIVEFERMLAEEGTVIVKLFLHISKGEQKARLLARLDDPDKHWKFNPGDLDDRARWGEFMHVYGEVIGKTSKKHAPWFIVPADRKWYRNLCVARIMVDTLRGLGMKYPTPEWDPAEIVID